MKPTQPGSSIALTALASRQAVPPYGSLPHSRWDLPRDIPVAWFTLHDAGKNPESVAKVRAPCAEYGLYPPEEVTALRAAEKTD